MARLAERGHTAVRSAHSAVFQYLDDTGTTVTALAERAQVTKQAMAELVQHLEAHGYVTRTPDPTDRRAKLVRPTDRGRELLAIARELVPALDERVSRIIGAERGARAQGRPGGDPPRHRRDRRRPGRGSGFPRSLTTVPARNRAFSTRGCANSTIVGKHR
jgi:DNA-binding MarR family transcriptional regulator